MRSPTFYNALSVAALIAGALSLPAQTAGAAPAKKKPPAKNAVKGQGQVSGLYATFGTTYTLKNRFNFTLLSARYTLEPFSAYATVSPNTEQKILVVDIALKNVAATDNFFNDEHFMTLVDEKGQLYGVGGSCLALKSMGKKSPNTNLKPGQGIGQRVLKDPLQMACAVPGNARIVKIILNIGRLGRNEEVLRYNIAGATKEEAGAAGDPRNVIAPLPENVRDPADKSGAVALAHGQGKIGEYEPSGFFALRLDDVAVSTDKFKNEDAPAGKKLIAATVTAKFLLDDPSSGSMFYVEGGDYALYEIKDSDGERYRRKGFRKAKRDEDPDHHFERGEEDTFRVLFIVPKDVTLKTLQIGGLNARTWIYDVSNVK